MSIRAVDISAVQQTLMCPVELEPLFVAVTLIPCMHKVNETVVDRLQNKCPECRAPFGGWGVDNAVRNLARTVFVDVDPLAYPGEKTIFDQALRRWDHITRSEMHSCCRGVAVRNSGDSFLKYIQLYGYWDGTITFVVKCPNDGDSLVKMRKYFTLHSVRYTWRATGLMEIVDIPSIKTAFRLIAAHNDIPAEQYEVMRTVIERGRCEVPPQFAAHG